MLPLVSTQAPAQSVSVAAQTQLPALQVVPAMQVMPQAPQFWLSSATSAQAPLQSSCPAAHIAGMPVVLVAAPPPAPLVVDTDAVAGPPPSAGGALVQEAKSATSSVASTASGARALVMSLLVSWEGILTNEEGAFKSGPGQAALVQRSRSFVVSTDCEFLSASLGMGGRAPLPGRV
jgi:hypothetical protein